MALLVVEGVGDLFFDKLLLEPLLIAMGFDSYTDFSTLFIQLYFFIVVIAELMRKGSVCQVKRAVIFILSFLGITTIGTLLLMMPEMTTSGSGMRALDALFTSTSATCVTGLMVETL